MKKFLFLVMAALLVGASVTSCKGKSESNKLNDSIAELMGKMIGTDLKAGMQMNPEMSQELDINGVAEVAPATWKIKFKDLSAPTITGDAVVTTAPTITSE